MDSDFSEQRSAFSEFRSEPAAGRAPVSSVALAQQHSRELGKLLAPDQGWKAQVSAIHRAITNPAFAWRLQGLTWNRVRSWLFAEARRVDYEEVRALEELRAEQELRRARRQLAASAIILATHYEQAGETLARDEMLVLGRRHGALDLPGDAGGAR